MSGENEKDEKKKGKKNKSKKSKFLKQLKKWNPIFGPISLLISIAAIIVSMITATHIPKTYRFSSRIAYVSYLELEELVDNEEFKEFIGGEINEIKYSNGIRQLLTHSMDKNSLVEIVVVELVASGLTVNESISDVSIVLNEYSSEEYNPDFAYLPEEISNMVIKKEDANISSCKLDLKTFKVGRRVAIVLSVTEPIKKETDLEIMDHTFFNNLPRVALACHVDTENEVIGVIEYTYNNKRYKEEILEMKSRTHID